VLRRPRSRSHSPTLALLRLTLGSLAGCWHQALINISTQQGAPADFSFCRELMKLELPTALLKATRSFSRPEQLPMLFPVLRLLFFFCSDDAARAEIGLEHLTGAVTDVRERCASSITVHA